MKETDTKTGFSVTFYCLFRGTCFVVTALKNRHLCLVINDWMEKKYPSICVKKKNLIFSNVPERGSEDLGRK